MTDLDALWTRWNAGGRQRDDRDRLIERGQSLAETIATSVVASLPRDRGVEVEDLASIGIIGLIRAIDRFDPERGVRFQTFAQHRVRGAMMDHLRTADHLPSATRRLVTRLGHAESVLTTKLGRVPTDAELAGYMAVSERKVASLRRLEVASLAAVEEIDEGHHISDGNGEGTVLDYGLLKRRLVEALDQLDGPEQVVMVLYYVEELGMPQIGKLLGVAPSMVSKLRDQAMTQVLGSLRS